MRFFLRVSGSWGGAQAQWSPWEQQGRCQLIVTVGFCTGRAGLDLCLTIHTTLVKCNLPQAVLPPPPSPAPRSGFQGTASLLACFPLNVEREWASG